MIPSMMYLDEVGLMKTSLLQGELHLHGKNREKINCRISTLDMTFVFTEPVTSRRYRKLGASIGHLCIRRDLRIYTSGLFSYLVCKCEKCVKLFFMKIQIL